MNAVTFAEAKEFLAHLLNLTLTINLESGEGREMGGRGGVGRGTEFALCF